MIVEFELTEVAFDETETSYIEEMYFDEDAKISAVITTAKHFIDVFERVCYVRFYFDNSFYCVEKDTFTPSIVAAISCSGYFYYVKKDSDRVG